MTVDGTTIKFQFQLVRLKVAGIETRKRQTGEISIPTGTIKRCQHLRRNFQHP